MRRALWLLLACTACGKELNPQFCRAHPDDTRCADGPDSAVDAAKSLVPVEHLDVATELMLTSTADVTVTASTVIDTTLGTITPEWADAVVLPSVAQEGGGEVMVIQVGSLTVDAAANVIDVTGDKPLVIVATRTLNIAARIDVSADGPVPGPGGYAGGAGPGAGSPGMPTGATGDGGGGGGSFGSLGGHGGNPTGGVPGALYGSAATLEGGSGGGASSMPGTCTIVAGAGGGALQLTALESLTLDTRINAGGSGGAGGEGCGSNGSGGAGGGAGGMVFLESPQLLGSGLIGANGGGGGEGAEKTGSLMGASGGDAYTDTAGTAGAGLTDGGDGGAGAVNTDPGQQGQDMANDNNGGGGGGGGGRIYYRTTGAQPTFTASPPATSA